MEHVLVKRRPVPTSPILALPPTIHHNVNLINEDVDLKIKETKDLLVPTEQIHDQIRVPIPLQPRITKWQDNSQTVYISPSESNFTIFNVMVAFVID